eukprot:9921951-Lingulodinium_polyedra.AAC.1
MMMIGVRRRMRMMSINSMMYCYDYDGYCVDYVFFDYDDHDDDVDGATKMKTVLKDMMMVTTMIFLLLHVVVTLWASVMIYDYY